MTQSVCVAPAALPRSGLPRPGLARTAAAPKLASPGAVFSRLVLLLLEWQRRARERENLAGLSDSALRDVGLSRVDIYAEAAKPFWRV